MVEPVSTPRHYLSPDDFMEIATDFQRSRILLTAFELGIFTTLGKDRQSSAEVAAALKTDPRATDRLMNALCAIKLLHKEEGLFTNTSPSQKFLVKDQPGYMEGLAHIANLWEMWSTLTETVRTGRAVKQTGVARQDEAWRRAFIAAMHYRAIWQAPAVASHLDLSHVARILDVGGGSGAYAMAFVRVRDAATAVIFDLPEVIPLTRRFIAEEGFEGRIETVGGDYLRDDLGNGFDLVFLSAVLHSNGPEENELLIKKAAAALAPGGQLVVQDFVMDDDRASPPFGAVFALNMLVATERGDTYTESEIQSWMSRAGLGPLERKETGVGTTLIIGKNRDR